MTPKEEQWLAEYHRREAGDRIKGLYRTLWFWGVFAIIWLVLLFAEPDHKFNFSDCAFLMVIIFNSSNAVREITRNKRIVAGEKPAEPKKDSTQSREL